MIATLFTSSTRDVPEVRAVPRHIAIIMDGNGRWAKQRMLPRVVHLAGEREFRRRHARRSAASATSGSRSCQSGQRAVTDDVALKIC